MVSHMCVCWPDLVTSMRREMAETRNLSTRNLSTMLIDFCRNASIWWSRFVFQFEKKEFRDMVSHMCVYYGVVLIFKLYFRSISFVVYFSRRSAFCVVIFNRWSSSVFMTYIVIVVFTKPAIYWSWTNLPLLINCWPSQTTVTLLIHYTGNRSYWTGTDPADLLI